MGLAVETNMEEWKKWKEKVWTRVGSLGNSELEEKYALRDVFLKLRFGQCRVKDTGEVQFSRDKEASRGEVTPQPSLSL